VLGRGVRFDMDGFSVFDKLITSWSGDQRRML
jgi:hypothetical protein